MIHIVLQIDTEKFKMDPTIVREDNKRPQNELVNRFQLGSMGHQKIKLEQKQQLLQPQCLLEELDILLKIITNLKMLSFN
jgi:hypothetical protein